jgi:uncharacterized membrane protein YhhN
MTLTFSIIALVSAVITIVAKHDKSDLTQLIFKPLTMLAIILLVFFNSSSPLTFYQSAILTGLILSTVGDVFLIRPDKYFLQGLTAFLFGHICFVAGFWTVPNWPTTVLYLVYFVFFFRILWNHLGSLKIPVVIYGLTLALMSWMALSRYLETNETQSLLAFAGSILFIASDSLLAFNKFKSPFRYAHLWILATYFAAQWLIALSV